MNFHHESPGLERKNSLQLRAKCKFVCSRWRYLMPDVVCDLGRAQIKLTTVKRNPWNGWAEKSKTTTNTNLGFWIRLERRLFLAASTMIIYFSSIEVSLGNPSRIFFLILCFNYKQFLISFRSWSVFELGSRFMIKRKSLDDPDVARTVTPNEMKNSLLSINRQANKKREKRH